MNTQKGLFVWYELLTSDVDAAVAFYGAVAGWGAEAMPMPGGDYRMFKTGQGFAAGVTTLPASAKAMGAPSHWLGYLAVDDVDAATATAKAQGATVYQPPMDIPRVGRFAIFGDPQGATSAFFKAEGEPSPMHDRRQPGEFAWHELMCDDPDKALAFYAQFAGWQALEKMPMGPDGFYQLFGRAADQQLGGMMPKPAQMPASAWLYYIGVAALDPALARAIAAGGKVVHGPIEVPGGARVATLVDPQGAHFALMGP